MGPVSFFGTVRLFSRKKSPKGKAVELLKIFSSSSVDREMQVSQSSQLPSKL